MKTEAELKFPTLFLEKSLDAPYLERFSFPKIECEVLDEERVRTIVGVLETVSLWGGEELALLKDVAAKVDLLTGVCNSLQRCMTDAAHSTTKIIPVETLNESLGLSRPIFAVIEYDEGVFTATFYECEIFGEGESEFEALEDLRESVAQYYLQLRESRDRLGPLLVKHLRILEQVVEDRTP